MPGDTTVQQNRRKFPEVGGLSKALRKVSGKSAACAARLVATGMAVLVFGVMVAPAGADEIMDPRSADPEGGIVDTQQEIEAQLAAGRNVRLPDGEVRVEDLYIPAGLRVESVNRLGAIMVLREMTDKSAVRLGPGAGLRTVRVDGNGRNQASYTYDGYDTNPTNTIPDYRPPTVLMQGSGAVVNNVEAVDCIYDCFGSDGGNNRIIESEALGAGRHGFHVKGDWNLLLRNRAERTGVAWPRDGGGAGVAIGGRYNTIDGLTTYRTNGDGIAAYGSNTYGIKVVNSEFRSSDWHCVHAGGRGVLIADNYCNGAAKIGYLLANNWRPGYESVRANASGVIRDSIVINAQHGVRVTWAEKGVKVYNMKIYKSRYHNVSFIDVKNTYIRYSVLRFPGYKTGVACHIHRKNSRVHAPLTGSWANNLNYSGKTRPNYCG